MGEDAAQNSDGGCLLTENLPSLYKNIGYNTILMKKPVLTLAVLSELGALSTFMCSDKTELYLSILLEVWEKANQPIH